MSIEGVLTFVHHPLKKVLTLLGLLEVAEKIVRQIVVLIRYEALPLVWMDEAEGYEKVLIRRGQNALTYGPNYIGRNQENAAVCLPDIYWFHFNHARISVISSSVVLDDKQVVIERTIGPDQKSYDFSSGDILRHDQGTAVVKKIRKFERIEKGIFLCGNGSINYYHWIVETLPRLEFLDDLPAAYSQYPLLVDEEVFNIPSLLYTLNLFSKDHEIIKLSKHKSYIVDSLLWINSPNNLPFNLTGEQRFKVAYAKIDKLSIEFIRKNVLRDTVTDSGCESYAKKIFFCRKTERRKYNQDEISHYLASLGFKKVFMEDLSFQEQVRTVYSADFIVGPTGAAWTNLIFCRPDSKALCWMAEEGGEFSAFSTLAKLVNVDLRYVTFKAGVKETRELYEKDYVIDVEVIKSGLSSFNETV